MTLARWPKHPAPPERVVPDRDSAGYMHSGYPMMASAKDILNLSALTTQGDWGLFHELCHNHKGPAETFGSNLEVDVNLFSMYDA